MTALLGAAAGLLVSLGAITVVAAIRPHHGSAQLVKKSSRKLVAWGPGDTRRWIFAGVAGAATWLLTEWPVAGLIVSTAVGGLPLLLSTSKVATQSIARLEALEDWTRRLSDILVVGVGLEQAITTSLRSVPEPIRCEVATLSSRLSARVSTEVALREFADHLADGTGDFVVAALLLGHRRRGPGLAKALASVADSVAEEVAMRRRVEADRAKPRTTARAVTVIALAVVGLGALNGSYIKPYGSAVGQLVLLLVATMFVASLAWMRALTLSKPQPRLLTATPRQT